jgi:hypothetical protein
VKKPYEELHFYFLPSIIRVMKPRRMRCAGNVTRMEGRGIHIGYRLESDN